MAEDIKTAMIVNAARVKETAARTGGLIKSKSSGNIMRAMNKKGSEADDKVGPPPESRGALCSWRYFCRTSTSML